MEIQYNTIQLRKLGTIKVLPMTFGYRVGVFIRRRHVARTALQCGPREKVGFLLPGFLMGIKGQRRSLPPVSNRRKYFDMRRILCPSSSRVFSCITGHLHFLQPSVDSCSSNGQKPIVLVLSRRRFQVPHIYLQQISILFI